MKTILIVDDEERISKYIASQLEAEGYRTVTANNGKMAQTAIQTQRHIDLLITDLGMPAMSGLGLLSFVRSTEKYAELPCIVLTSHIQQDLIEKAAKKNVTKYLLKPVKIKELIDLVKKLIGPPVVDEFI